MTGLYYEDIKLHEKFRSRAYRLTQEAIIDFAKEWDPQPFHIDPDHKSNVRIQGLFASGIHLLALCVKLFSQTVPGTALVAGMGWDNIRFLAPARPGDDLIFEGAVVTKRESESDENVGVISYSVSLVNQNDEAVIQFQGTVLVAKYPRGNGC